ncbi:unnamed protein product [Aureobasidium vineae]|uniref:Uncharacterized protein n=1 Tax=Aureobasidium vineae TaxID=2773715 RepID=A0A9N8JA25_9PEZI|nr:unnamed protein product [Aureobasidium vineae]
MFMMIPPIDFQAQFTPKIYKSAARHSTIYSTNAVASVHHGSSSSSSPSDCLAQLEEARSMALKAQGKIQLLWIASTDNKSPARSVLPSLSFGGRSNDTFRRLQRLADKLNQYLSSLLSTNLKFEYSGTFKLNIASIIIKHEQKRLAHFLDVW